MQLSWVLSLLLALLFAFVLLLFFCFYSKWRSYKLWKTYFFYSRNRFHVALRLFSNRSQMTSTCVTNKKVVQKVQPRVSLMLLSYKEFRNSSTWLIYFIIIKKKKKTLTSKTQTSTYRCRFSSHKIRPAFQCGYSTNEGLFWASESSTASSVRFAPPILCLRSL